MRKPKVSPAIPVSEPVSAPVAEVVAPVAEYVAPIVVPIASPIEEPIVPIVSMQEPKPKRKAPPRKKPVAVPSARLPELVYKEVTLPTHIEKTLEVFDTDEYEIVHVVLTPFELNQVHYFRDSSKNKLFQKKGKGIGEYIGRYDPYTESIVTDIPDSDDES